MRGVDFYASGVLSSEGLLPYLEKVESRIMGKRGGI